MKEWLKQLWQRIFVEVSVRVLLLVQRIVMWWEKNKPQ